MVFARKARHQEFGFMTCISQCANIPGHVQNVVNGSDCNAETGADLMERLNASCLCFPLDHCFIRYIFISA